ncbi:XopAF/AvrXv3 family type III secretion system effector [Xanthomonas campestris]|uniref:XopAF/AvrXv3 family type III secretion system effector n=1 Tax=Xanthomonas campestris TaxID=339 RepID=UPI001E58D600|nr:XopAF/AvrXv3 family type III secretion system effector [Xanthomonas campestris]MCC4603675.1 type III effector [Xanthomonas campestris pv. parthenii]
MGLCITKSTGGQYGGDSGSPPSSPNVTASSSHQPTASNAGTFDGLNGRPPTLSHHRLARRAGQYTLKQTSIADYQSERGHPGNSIKDRSGSLFPWVRVSDVDADSNYSFEIDSSTTVKVAGFNGLTPNHQGTRHLYSAGTSQVNMPVVTDNMTACIAVACAAERIDHYTGERMPGAQVRVFHLLPFNHQELMPENVIASIRDYIHDVKAKGLTMRVAMYGGDRVGDFSVSTAEALGCLFENEGIPVEFNETCANRNSEALLGAVILNDNSTQFIKHLVAA